jgi:hypothetical protein
MDPLGDGGANDAAGHPAVIGVRRSGPGAGQRTQDFSADPQWEGYRNRLPPAPAPITRQDFGYRTTKHVGGANLGEFGGWIQRSLTPA